MDDRPPSRPGPPGALFTVAEALPILRMGRSKLYELVRDQKVPHRKIHGRGVYFTAEDLQQIIDDAARPALAS